MRENHLDDVRSKVSKGLEMLRRMRPFAPENILIKVYKSLVLPYSDHCSLVWGNTNNSMLDKLQKLQNRAARIITGKSYETRSSDMLSDLNWKNLKEFVICNLIASPS